MVKSGLSVGMTSLGLMLLIASLSVVPKCVVIGTKMGLYMTKIDLNTGPPVTMQTKDISHHLVTLQKPARSM